MEKETKAAGHKPAMSLLMRIPRPFFKRKAPPPDAPPGARGQFRMTSEGRYWLVTTLALVGIGLYKNINLIALVGYFMLAVAALNVVVAGRWLRGLRARRQLPELLFARKPGTVTVEMTNALRRAQLGVRIEDGGPDHSLAWFVPRLEGGGGLSVTRDVVIPHRGVYAWGSVTAVSGYPFGFFERRRPLGPPEESLVLPALGWVHRGRLRRHLRGADPTSDRSRGATRPDPAAQTEFHGLRSFRTGDSPRMIHWKTSARRGELMVREFEDLPTDNLILVLDPVLPAGGDPAAQDAAFEEAVSLAASVCWEWCRRSGDRLVVAVAGPEPETLDGVTGGTHARRILECLARVQPAHPPAGGAGRRAPGDEVRKIFALLAGQHRPQAAALVIGVGTSPLAGVLHQELRRPVLCLDSASVTGLDFYEPPAP